MVCAVVAGAAASSVLSGLCTAACDGVALARARRRE